MLRTAHLATLAAVAGLLAACGADGGSAVGGPGRQVYLQQCAACHGVNREGIADAPPLPVERMVELGRPQLRSIVNDGIGTMEGFADVLTTPEVDRLVAYLVTGDG